jgi:uncharacterized protein (DUF302 family)
MAPRSDADLAPPTPTPLDGIQAQVSGGIILPMLVTRSGSDYAVTVERLVEGIERRGLTVFARFDHAAAARESGMELADEQVVVFGDPRAGTPLMQSDPRIGLELPLRILVWRDPEGVLLGHADPRDLRTRYDVAEHDDRLERIGKLLADLAAEAAA